MSNGLGHVMPAGAMRPGGSFLRHLFHGWGAFICGWWILQALLLGTGLTAIDRVLPQLQAERVAAIARLVVAGLGATGQPLAAADALDRMAQPILASDAALRSVALWDRSGELLIRVGESGDVHLTISDGQDSQPRGTDVRSDGHMLQAVVPVAAGSVTVTMDRLAAGRGAWRLLPPMLVVALPLPFFHLILVSGLRRRLDGRKSLSWWAVNGMTGMISGALLLGALLAQIHDNTRKFEQVLNQTVQAMAYHSPDLSTMVGELVQVDPHLDGYALFRTGEQPQVVAGGSVLPERIEDVALRDGWSVRLVRTAAGAEMSAALWRGLKNLAVLLMAMALLCGVLGGAGEGLREPFAGLWAESSQNDSFSAENRALAAIRPIYFLAVLAENLCAPFMPRVLHGAVDAAQLPETMASALFMVYFVAFTAVLLPAGWLAGRFGPVGLVRGGTVLLAMGLGAGFLSLDAWTLLAARLLMGTGQGILLIGVQSLILAASAHGGKRTAATAIIVFGFNGGMVGGNAFGSLLVEQTGVQMMFAIAGLTALAVAGLAWLTLPGHLDDLVSGDRERQNPGIKARSAVNNRGPGFGGLRCLFDPAFLITTLCVGIPTKALLTGVVLFALPLVLGRRGFSLEEVGQAAMFYAAGVLLSSSVMSRMADKVKGGTGPIMIGGMILSAAAMALVPLAGLPMVTGTWMETQMLLGCILFLGLAHGCINAPVVTHVADLPVAIRLGPLRVATTYRLLERMGHVSGPPLVGWVMAVCATDSQAIGWIAGITGFFGILFLFHQAGRFIPGRDG